MKRSRRVDAPARLRLPRGGPALRLEPQGARPSRLAGDEAFRRVLELVALAHHLLRERIGQEQPGLRGRRLEEEVSRLLAEAEAATRALAPVRVVPR